MSRLDSLVAELCPNGVEYVQLKTIANIGTGSSDRINAVENGEYPFYVRSKTVFRSSRFLFDEESIVIPGEGGIGDIFHYVVGKYDLHQRAYRINFADGNVNTKYAYYYMATHFKTFILMKAVSATVTSIRKPMIEDFPIPVPPLEVQNEIVRILDNFTELTTELTARKKQHNYYRDSLLNFGDDVQVVALSQYCLSIADGDHQAPPKADCGIPFITISNVSSAGIIDFSNTKFVSEEYYNALADKRKAQIGDILYTVVGSFGIPVCCIAILVNTLTPIIPIVRIMQKLTRGRYVNLHNSQNSIYRRRNQP